MHYIADRRGRLYIDWRDNEMNNLEKAKEIVRENYSVADYDIF